MQHRATEYVVCDTKSAHAINDSAQEFMTTSVASYDVFINTESPATADADNYYVS